MTRLDRGAAGIRVLVVDDHDLFRTGLVTLLSSQPDVEVVAQASGGRMALHMTDYLRPDVVLMDLRLPDLHGSEVTSEIVSRHPDTRVVVLTGVFDNAAVLAAMEAGACGFLAKDTPIDGVVDAVRAAAHGAAWLSPQAAEVVLGSVRHRARHAVADLGLMEQLSVRELDVLRLLARGLDNGEIAQELGISQRTAKNHVSKILSKLGLPSRVQAAIYAVRGGLS
jgi:two-component system, NarL family, response regulator LiaR